MPRINYVSTNGPGGPVQAVSMLGAEASDYGYVEIGSDGLNQPGSFPFRIDQSGNVSVNGGRLTAPVAVTAAGGFALQNGTPTILSWTAPNDGAMHWVTSIPALIHVTGAETGGLVQVSYFGFTGAAQHVATLFAAGLGTDTAGQAAANAFSFPVAPGTVVAVTQTSALTAGAAVVFASIWAS